MESNRPDRGTGFLQEIVESWRNAFTSSAYRKRFFITLPFFIGIIVSLPYHFTYFENRRGFLIPDPFLDLYAPIDVSLYTFLITYSAGFLGFLHVFSKAGSALPGMQAYVIMIGMRLICLYLVALAPPATIIPLRDVLLERFFYSGQPYQNDLFFSGHTATIFLFGLAARTRGWKIYLFISALLIGAGVLIQHVHWTVDVIAAPFFAILAWRIATLINDHGRK